MDFVALSDDVDLRYIQGFESMCGSWDRYRIHIKLYFYQLIFVSYINSLKMTCNANLIVLEAAKDHFNLCVYSESQ